MTMIPVRTFEMFPSIELSVANTANILIDASGEKVAFVFQIPKNGNITDVVFRTGTVTTPQTLAVTLQTLGTDGNPSGSNYGSCVKGTQAAPATATNYIVTLGTPATAVEGDYVAVVIEFDSTAGSLNISGSVSANLTFSFPYVTHFTSAWAKSSSVPMVSLKYDDGSYESPRTVIAGTPAASANLSSSTTPDEKALKFKYPVQVRCCGAILAIAGVAAADFDVVLYDSDGTSVLASKSVDGAASALASLTMISVRWAGVTLLADTFYRLALKPTTTTAMTHRELTVLAAAQLEAAGGTIITHSSARTDGGSWTDTTTVCPQFAPLINGIEVSAGGGGEHSFGSFI